MTVIVAVTDEEQLNYGDPYQAVLFFSFDNVESALEFSRPILEQGKTVHIYNAEEETEDE